MHLFTANSEHAPVFIIFDILIWMHEDRQKEILQILQKIKGSLIFKF